MLEIREDNINMKIEGVQGLLQFMLEKILLLLCRVVFRGFWVAIIRTRIGVGFGLLGELGETARRRNRNEVKRQGIGRAR